MVRKTRKIYGVSREFNKFLKFGQVHYASNDNVST